MSIQKARNGECPNCSSNDLDYGSAEPTTGNQIYYPFTCKSCGKSGKEWWELTDGETEIVER